ncbi:MAG TPA: cytochrome c oxidase subunit 3 [Blastocatellia bacterium]|nr:cytochrome c oxidase subunit 3 [Blastocatellia bacterium]
MARGITTGVKVKPSGLGGGMRGPNGGDGPDEPGSDGPKNWPPGYSRDDAIEPTKYRIGMWVGLASILMLFVSLTSAYIVRQTSGLSDDSGQWISIKMPWELWLSTGLLLASSVTFELARRALRRNGYSRFNLLISLTTFLGVGFLAGQVMAWRHLAAQGIYLASNPHSSFFYLLTSLHAIHLIGGLVALISLTVFALRLRIGSRQRNAVEITALYWHFMDGLWIYLFLLLFFWR